MRNSMTRSMNFVSVSWNPVESRARKVGNQCILHHGRCIVHPLKQVLAQQHSCQFWYQLRYTSWVCRDYTRGSRNGFVRTRIRKNNLGKYASNIRGKTVWDLFIFFAPDISDLSSADRVRLCFGAHSDVLVKFARGMIDRRGKCDAMPGETKFTNH